MGIVYSTDASFKLKEDQAEATTPAAEQQNLRIKLDTKHRAGKAVTLVEGFTGNNNDAAELGKKLKSFCGTGGSVKDGDIIVQGDNREKVFNLLLKNVFKKTKKV